MSIDLALELFITWGAVAVYLVLVALDFLAPGRPQPKVPGWRIAGVAGFVVFNAIALYAPFLWDEALASHRLVDLTQLPFAAQAAIGFLVYELFAYGWHRMLHGVPALWRIHQMHHAAERIDIFGAYWFHPLGGIGWTLVTSLALVWAVGLVPEAALTAATVVAILASFQHANLRTPRWLGLFVARPEMHGVHHERGVHRYNYGDIALFDMIFGTWRNPATFEGENGILDGGSLRILDQLLGRDLERKARSGETLGERRGDEIARSASVAQPR